jgi:hypothetical protein
MMPSLIQRLKDNAKATIQDKYFRFMLVGFCAVWVFIAGSIFGVYALKWSVESAVADGSFDCPGALGDAK